MTDKSCCKTYFVRSDRTDQAWYL